MFLALDYTYLVADILLLFIWLIFFLHRKDLRKEMLIVSLLSAPVGLTQYFFVQDYWHPVYIWGSSIVGLEDILYMFATGGIVGVLYEEFFGRHFAKRHLKGHPIVTLLMTVLGVALMFVGMQVFHLNSIYVASALFLIFGSVTIIFRHDLLYHAFWSGILLGLVTTVFEILMIFLFPTMIRSWWILENLSGVALLGVPIEEIIFASTFGFVAGPMYEFVFGLKLKK